MCQRPWPIAAARLPSLGLRDTSYISYRGRSVPHNCSYPIEFIDVITGPAELLCPSPVLRLHVRDKLTIVFHLANRLGTPSAASPQGLALEAPIC